MLALLASLRGSPSFIFFDLGLFLQLLLILFQLPFKAKIWQHYGPTFADKGDCLFEPPAVLPHEVCDDKC